jgi:hypothetical protein
MKYFIKDLPVLKDVGLSRLGNEFDVMYFLWSVLVLVLSIKQVVTVFLLFVVSSSWNNVNMCSRMKTTWTSSMESEKDSLRASRFRISQQNVKHSIISKLRRPSRRPKS